MRELAFPRRSPQAAERLGVTPSRVRMLIRDGRLPAEMFGKGWMVKEADLKLVEIVRLDGRQQRKRERNEKGNPSDND